MEWQPIETAPKDGTEILGWREDCGILMIRYICPNDFCTERELDLLDLQSAEQSDWFAADWCAGGRLEGDLVPTHWVPLPQPPRGE